VSDTDGRGVGVVTLVAAMSSAAPGAVEAAIAACASLDRAAADVVIGVSPATADALARRDGTAGSHVRIVVMEDPDVVGPVLANVRTPYFAALDTVAGVPGVAACIAGLDANPAAVLAWTGAPEFSAEVATLLDGRLLATRLVGSGRSPFGGIGAVVARTAALGEERFSPGYRCGAEPDWPALCWLRLMVRGAVWCDGSGGFAGASAARSPALDSGSASDARWRSVSAEARALGLLPAGSPTGSRLRAGVVVLAGDPAGARGGRLRAIATARRAARLVESVLVLEAADEPPPAPIAGVEWRLLDWRAVDWRRGLESGTLGGAPDLPLVLLAAGEQLEVADDAQLRASLEALEPGGRARVVTPAGVEVRLGVRTSLPAALPAPEAGGPALRSVRIAPLGGAGDWLEVRARPRRSSAHRITRFAVCAPDYTGGSGGSIALHRLCDLLNASGCEAWIVPIEAGAVTNPDWRGPLAGADGPLPPDAVAIYPEIISGNPLGAGRVVRWLLNRPGAVNGGAAMDEQPEDLLLAYDPQIDADLPVLWVPVIDPTVFFPKDRPGSGRLLWIGKGRAPAGLDRSGTTVITRSWPATKRELAEALRGADALVSCDWLTAMIGEALMCATPVVLVDDDRWSADPTARVDPSVQVCTARWGEPEAALAAAREAAADFYGVYTARYAGAAAGIDDFLARVQDHFAAA